MDEETFKDRTRRLALEVIKLMTSGLDRLQNRQSKIQNLKIQNALCARGQRGQVLLEFAISLIAIVALFGMLVGVWLWMNSSLILRQRAFQGTRLIAGQPGTAGFVVPYQASTGTGGQ